MTVALLDSGPLVALFARRERMHSHYKSLLARQTEVSRLHTTWPCITEASHFLQGAAKFAMLQWIGEGAAAVFPFDQEAILDMIPVMRRYTEPSRSKMDFADASLYWLAHETGVTRILTIDVRDFSRYRLPDGRAFELL
jgi:hypothetical protein